MPYTIPNEAGAGFADQAEPDQRDFEILTAGLSHGTSSAGSYGLGPTGVESGCAVTAQGSPDMTVAVAAGTVRIGGRLVKVAAGNVTITAADGTNPRFDLVVVDTAAAKTAIAGTAAANAVFPTITAGRVVLAAVYVPASDTAINTNQITDKRVMIDEPSHENVKWYGALGDGATNDQAAIQAAVNTAYDTSLTTGRTRTVFFPRGEYRVSTTVTLPQSIRLQGVGKPTRDARNGSWITSNASSISLLTVPSDATLRRGLQISNLGFSGSLGHTSITGITINNMNSYLIDNCAFTSNSGAFEMTTGLYLRWTESGMDHNYNSVTNCEFHQVVTGVDAWGVTGVSFRGVHMVLPDSSGAIGIMARADATGTTFNLRIVDSEFILPNQTSYGVWIQGQNNMIIGSRFEGGFTPTGSVGVRFEKVAGSIIDSGRRNSMVCCSVLKCFVGIDITANVTQTAILGVDYGGNTTNITNNGTETTYFPTFTGEIARLAVALDWPVVTAPANPASGFQRFYVDTADGIFKSKSSAGTISVYGARQRSLFIDASVLRMDAASGVKLGSPPTAVDGVSLVNGVTSGAYCNFIMPVDVITGTVTIRPIWVPSASTAAQTVQWQRNIKIISGADVTAAGESASWTGDSAVRTQNVEVMESGTGAATTITPAASDRIRLEIQRLGAHASDTYTGDVYLIGFRVDYQANN